MTKINYWLDEDIEKLYEAVMKRNGIKIAQNMDSDPMSKYK